MPKDKISKSLKNALEELKIPLFEPQVEVPKNTFHGDFSTNIAMVAYARIIHSVGSGQESEIKNPLELAEQIVRVLNYKFLIINSDFSKIEIASPGFINFYLSDKYLQTQIQNIIKQGDDYGSLIIGRGKKVSVEFVSANPTGPLHIGNAVGGPLGDVIANVLEKSGYQVVREYLHNDVGGQILKLGESIYFELNPNKKSGNQEVQYKSEYIKDLAQKISKSLEVSQLSKEEFVKKAGKAAVEILLTEIFKDCADMGIKFDKVRKESDLRREVPNVLSKLQKFLKEKDGALWFAPSDEFLKDRETVVIKSNGEFTYFASDIVYHDEKMSKNNMVIDILGPNHSGHVPRLQAIIKALGYDAKNFKVILHQYVRLKKGKEIVKMEKRTGNFVTAKEVLDEVGKDAFRFFLLRSAPEAHMDFDLDLAKKQASDNPVFYVQYAYTRMCSIFAKTSSYQGSTCKGDFSSVDVSLIREVEEVALIRHLIKLPKLIEDVSYTFGVHAFTIYAMELAALFHRFYEVRKVISEDKKQTNARLALLEAARITLKNTLNILGVSTPEHM